MTKIAVIDDVASIAEMYELKLKNSGYEVRIALDGPSGLKLLEDFKPKLVLLDLMLPGMTGQELLKKARATDWGKDMKVIVLTNVSTEEAPDELTELDISRYIIKAQVTPQQIVDMVKEILAAKD